MNARRWKGGSTCFSIQDADILLKAEKFYARKFDIRIDDNMANALLRFGGDEDESSNSCRWVRYSYF